MEDKAVGEQESRSVAGGGERAVLLWVERTGRMSLLSLGTSERIKLKVKWLSFSGPANVWQIRHTQQLMKEVY